MSNTYDKVLITGRRGMLASALIELLRRRKIEFHAFDKIELDVTDADSFDTIFEELQPTLVLNCAAYTKVDQAELEPKLATLVNDVQVFTNRCREYGSKLVHFSTDFVFDGRSTRPYKPADPTNPLSVYGASKLAGEEMVHEHNAETGLIIRTSWLYGLSGPNFVQTMLNAARAGKPLTVVDDQIGSPTFTHDLAETTLDLIDRGATGTYHATNSGQTTWFEFAKAIFEEFDIPNVDLKPISSAKWKEVRPASASRPAYSVLDCSETEKLIGRPMPDWREALHRYRLAIDGK